MRKPASRRGYLIACIAIVIAGTLFGQTYVGSPEKPKEAQDPVTTEFDPSKHSSKRTDASFVGDLGDLKVPHQFPDEWPVTSSGNVLKNFHANEQVIGVSGEAEQPKVTPVPVPQPSTIGATQNVAHSESATSGVFHDAPSLASDPEILAQLKILAKDEIVAADLRSKKVSARDAALLNLQSEAFSVNAWQSLVIFFIAHAVLLLGIGAAGSEFLHASRVRKSTQEAATTDLKLGLEGIAVKTALHGVLLLLISMGYYYLYLKFVYPISVVPV